MTEHVPSRGRWLLFILFLVTCGTLFALPPADFTVFKETALRLLNNHQYSYLGEYYRNYAVPFKDEKDLYELTAYLALHIPKAGVKKEILKTCLNFRGQNRYQDILLREYGLLLYFEGNDQRALRVFGDCGLPVAGFYLGQLHHRGGSLEAGRKALLKFTGTTGMDEGLVRRGYLTLAEIYYKEKKYQSAYKYALKSALPSARRAILLYQIYDKTGELQKREQVLQSLRQKYAQAPEAKDFLAELEVVR